MNKEKEQKDSRYAIVSMILVICAVVAAWIFSELNRKRKVLKSKGQLAAEYGIKLDVFLKWINLFCPAWYAKAYAQTAKKKIPEYDIYRVFGKPEPDKVFSKQTLAEECCVSRNILKNHIASIKEFEKEIGISIEQYLKMRVFPPKVFYQIIELHLKHFPALPNKIQ